MLPATWTLAPGASVQLLALANCGTLIPADVTQNPATVWSVVDTGSAATGTVSATGDFTAGTALGDVTVQAVYSPAGGPAVSGNTDITISGVPVLSVTVAPATASLHPGTVESFTATALFDGGATQNVTLFAAWASDDSDVALAPCNGIPGEVCAQDAGSATLTATYNSVAGQSQLTVLPASTLVSVAVTPATTDVPQGPAVCQAYDAVGTYSDTTTGPVEAAWDVAPDPGLDGGVALVPGLPPTSAELCLGDNVAAQTFDVTADAGGLTGGAQLTVCAATVQLLSFTPLKETLHCGSGSDAGLPCVFLAAEALERYCGQEIVSNVNAIASWSTGTLPTGVTFFDGLLCAKPATCPAGQSVSITATYGGKSVTENVSIAL